MLSARSSLSAPGPSLPRGLPSWASVRGRGGQAGVREAPQICPQVGVSTSSIYSVEKCASLGVVVVVVIKSISCDLSIFLKGEQIYFFVFSAYYQTFGPGTRRTSSLLNVLRNVSKSESIEDKDLLPDVSERERGDFIRGTPRGRGPWLEPQRRGRVGVLRPGWSLLWQEDSWSVAGRESWAVCGAEICREPGSARKQKKLQHSMSPQTNVPPSFPSSLGLMHWNPEPQSLMRGAWGHALAMAQGVRMFSTGRPPSLCVPIFSSPSSPVPLPLAVLCWKVPGAEI